MNSVKKISIVLSVLLMAYVVPSMADETYTCSHDNKQRVIAIKYDVDGQSVPCEVHYTKDTGTERLWRAEGQVGYCEEKAAEFVAKQESWGWSCDKQGDSMVEKVAEMATEELNEAMDKAGDAMAQ